MNAKRCGFTLVELLVVIAIIGILISLMLPAIMAAREAARRASCVHQLAQLGIALQNYQNANEVLPPGVVNPTGPILSIPKGYHFSWIAQLLPYIEQLNTFNAIDFKRSAYDKANDPARKVHIELLLCPSDPTSPNYMGQYELSSYAGCHHDVEAPIDADNHGVFFLNSAIRDKDIPDGRSHTIFLGEKVADITLDERFPPAEIPNLGWISGTQGTLRNAGWLLSGLPDPASGNPFAKPKPEPEQKPQEKPGPDSDPAAPADAGMPMEDSAMPPGSRFDIPDLGMGMGPGMDPATMPGDGLLEPEPPAGPRALESILVRYEAWASADPQAAKRDASRVGGFTSGHPGVVNFLFGDGAVRSLSKITDPGLLQQLAHRADGKLLVNSQSD